jgi:Protein tyrosine/serine phosphatase
MKRILNLEGAINLRELGGYKTASGQQIKYNKLLRSGDISNLTPQALNYLKKYGLKYVVDFRSNREQDAWSDQSTDFYKIYSDPIYPLKGNGEKLMNAFDRQQSYLGMIYQSVLLDSYGQRAYKEFFNILLKNKQPKESVLFHCARGKRSYGNGRNFYFKGSWG